MESCKPLQDLRALHRGQRRPKSGGTSPEGFMWVKDRLIIRDNKTKTSKPTWSYGDC